ncbi:hypothetical protein [Limosilactobacillus reuteri]|uniref:Uncharacterized protein n=1 Tax=Limosilactobacillus reuteri TaxID=1598 RepID=A0A347TAJ5_LIMRT|nr:hypothetical protein [Limosilactobacillus reuteri]AXX74944.1 hypothetical protein DL317_09780 [Limosilactobacillus reuteri]MRG69150.1 hypothetical protein [Limosilactobacillus reuteri]WLR79359.1 hypothetical protein Q3A95_09265 [Limosilactobacillus reuteri]
MAERRMLSKSLLMDNKFLTLSNDSKSLYLYLLMFADDDGIVKRSIMIDSVLNATNKNYTELEEKGLIIAISGNDEIRVITNWNGIETIREKLYSPTIYLNIRSQLYLRTDYSYTLNKNDPSVFSSADSWVTKGRPKNIKDFNPLIQQHLQEVQDKDGISTVPVQDKDGTCPSPDKNRIDKYSVDKSRTAQANSEQTKKENKFKYINSSSNGGMGEILLNDGSSTSSIENNATTENGGNSAVDSRANQDTVSSLFNYLNGISTTDIPKDNKRLADVFDMLIHNGYEIEDIQLGIDNIMNVANQMPQYQDEQSLANLLIQHLPEYTKQTLEQSSSND